MRFRSRFERYEFKGLRFDNFTASSDDTAVIVAARKDPSFGPGLDFWEDIPPAAPAKTDTETDDKKPAKTDTETDDKKPEKSGRK